MNKYKRILLSISVLLVLFISVSYIRYESKKNNAGNYTITPPNADSADEPESLPAVNPDTDTGETAQLKKSLTKDFRGVWVSTVLNLDYPKTPTTDSETLKKEAVKILDFAVENRLNAVILQVRPSADALYKSKYFPWSKYLTGKQGFAPDKGFDPLEFWVNEAHKRGIELHAWINPYRITKKLEKDPDFDISSLAKTNPAVKNPNWVVKHKDGNLYFNPGLPEVRNYIIKSVLEITDNYNVDGIHLDDYFYPDSEFEDNETFKKFNKDNLSIEDWRRQNVDLLISGLSKALHEKAPGVSFGVSPFGIWANVSSNPLGSDTNGGESLNQHYADTREWVKKAYVDYITPQLYWNIGCEGSDYEKLLSWWSDVVKGTGVDLYIGHAAYKCENENENEKSDGARFGPDEIIRQLDMNNKNPCVCGSVFFRYGSLSEKPELISEIRSFYEKKDLEYQNSNLKISRPADNIKTTYDNFYITGSSDPSKPLYLNGAEIRNRSKSGYFGVLANLSDGLNKLTFSQGEFVVKRIILKNISKPSLEKAYSPFITTVFPKQNEYRMPGETIILKCMAPLNSKVSVNISGKSYEMKPTKTKIPDNGIYNAEFRYAYKIPEFKGVSRFIDLGAPIYKIKYKGITKEAASPAKIGVIMPGAPFYAEITKDLADTYKTSSSSFGSELILTKGMSDYVTGETGNYVRLGGIGLWVEKSCVKTFYTVAGKKIKSLGTSYEPGHDWDKISVGISVETVSSAEFDGKKLKFDIYYLSDIPNIDLGKSTLFSGYTAEKHDDRITYVFTVYDSLSIGGYYVSQGLNSMDLFVKHAKKADPGSKNPLKGITVMIDPGHGGNALGAIGPTVSIPEKTVNLDVSLKLRNELKKLGAAVYMTRDQDKDVSLDDRLKMSFSIKPDLFISVHANSASDETNMSKLSGFSVYYKHLISEFPAQTVHNNVIKSLLRNDLGVNRKNFYVLHSTFSPSILIEMGYMPNPHEFEWLKDKSSQTELSKCIADAVVLYFLN